MKRILFALLLCFAGHAEAVTATFTPDTTSAFPNPRKGWHVLAGNNGLLDSSGQFASDLATIRDGGITVSGFPFLTGVQNRLAQAETVIPTVVTGGNLTTMTTNFAAVRAAGMMVIPRFTCGEQELQYCDPTIAQVQAQAAAIKPILLANRDVIAFVQCGLLGVYGEWAEVNNGNDSKANKRTIKDACMDMVPAEIPVEITQVYPQMEDWYAGLPPASASIAFSGGKQARNGFHSDCFLTGNGDSFFYPGPATVNDFVITGSRASQRNYVAAATEFVPFGGETCFGSQGSSVQNRTGCTSANDAEGNSGGIMNEGPRYHLAHLNMTYEVPHFISSWNSGGCFSQITNLLGYRLQYDSITHAATAAKGSVATFTVQMRNYGWSRAFDNRTVQVLGISGSNTFVGYSSAKISACPSQATTSNCPMVIHVAIPAGQASGTYTLYLQMPSTYSTTQAANYWIRPANANNGSQVWDGTKLPTGTSISIP